MIYTKESVSVCGIYDLSKSVQAYAENLEGEGDVFFTDGDQIYGAADGLSGELAEKILVQTSGITDSFEEKTGADEYFGKRIGGTQTWIIYKKPITIFTYMNVIHMLLFLLTFSTLIIAWFVYRYIKENIRLPLQSLVETMNEVSRGDWDSVCGHSSRLEEIRRVDEAFNVMVSEIKKQKILSYEQTIEKQKAQMQYLQLQLKPHFYLNGLKTLNMLAMEGDRNGVGYPLHILEDINAESKEESVSVGINNLKRRCLFLYGGRGEYNFYNSGGAVSEIVLPYDEGGRL